MGQGVGLERLWQWRWNKVGETAVYLKEKAVKVWRESGYEQ